MFFFRLAGRKKNIQYMGSTMLPQAKSVYARRNSNDDTTHTWPQRDRGERARHGLLGDRRAVLNGWQGRRLGRSPQTIPIPGFKTLQQAEENARAMQFGALTAAQVHEITALLAREDQL
jgi:aryl-alcohol dehydrogenase-like predicted oxidoreductase